MYNGTECHPYSITGVGINDVNRNKKTLPIDRKSKKERLKLILKCGGKYPLLSVDTPSK